MHYENKASLKYDSSPCVWAQYIEDKVDICKPSLEKAAALFNFLQPKLRLSKNEARHHLTLCVEQSVKQMLLHSFLTS